MEGGADSEHKSEIDVDYEVAIEDELEAELLNGYCSDEAGDRSYSKKNPRLNSSFEKVEQQISKKKKVESKKVRENKNSQNSDEHLRPSFQADNRTEWQHAFPWDEEVDLANKVIFGNEVFRENQREIINATMSGKDVLALIPTGGGKSLTFQISAITG